VISATETALKVAQPVVGKIEDPVGKIDQCASEALAKVQEKLPIVNQTPSEIANSAKTTAHDTASYYYNKITGSNIGQQTTKHLDNAVSFSELMVEICFPTDGTNPDDLQELEKAEEDEDKGLVVRAANLKNRAVRRGTRKMMTYTPVKSTIDNVQYAQEQIHEMTEKILKGTNYVATKTMEVKDLVKDNYPTIKTLATETLTEGTQYVEKNWDQIYSTTMYIPKKAIQVTGSVYINAQEIVFAYTKAHSLTEIPHAVVEMAEKYYSNLKIDGLSVEQVKEKAIGFVYVPAQVVSEYLRASRVVQWVVPNSIKTESIEMVEVERTSSPENRDSETENTRQNETMPSVVVMEPMSTSPVNSFTETKPQSDVDGDFFVSSERKIEEMSE